MRGWFAATLTLGLAASPATAQVCANGVCEMRLTPEQVLARAETLVREGRFAEAAPLIQALEQAPATKLQSRFLAGYSASEQGDFARASSVYKAILSDDPRQTRVRLELAKAMLALGQTASADRQFQIAEQDDDLPADIARMIRGARAVIRSQRLWRLDMDFGFAPDSNISNATAVDTIDIRLGDLTLPVSLNPDARARSGTGQFATVNAGVRLPVSGKGAVLVDFNGAGTNYEGAAYDDYSLQVSAGPQLFLSDSASIFAQAVGAQRWYAGRSASHQYGAKLGGQLGVGDKLRLGLQLDARRTVALFDAGYSGWQAGLYANAERALSSTIVASAGLFARRDWLNAATFSSQEYGASLGVGGELPLGINFALGGSASRALYDAPMAIFSPDPRRDWRLSGQLTLGNRKLRFLGFSPSVSLSYAKTASTLPFFTTDRTRIRFALARYF